MPGSTFLEGETAALRTIEEDDLAFLRDGDNDPFVRRMAGGDATPTTLADERRAREAAGDRGAVQLLIVAGGERAGYVELDPVDHVAGTAEIGMWLAPEHRRQGHGPEAAALVADYAFEELRLHRLSAEAFASNEHSLDRLREVGYVEEGVAREAAFVDGEHVDVHRFGLLAEEWRGRASDESG